MPRKISHSEENEKLLEKLLSYLRFRKIYRFIPLNCKVLDLGCGFEGALLTRLEHIISYGVGIDISVKHNSDRPNTKLIKHNLNNKLLFDDEAFDVVISLATLEHLEDPLITFSEIYRVLVPGGLLLLTTPSTYAKPILELLSFKLHLISKQEIRDHKNYYNKITLQKYCQQTRFTFSQHEYFQFFMNNFLYAQK